MQILMGAHYTLVSIDESRVSTYNLFHFIKNQFSSREIKKNHILLNYSLENHYKHLFLIKWIYSMHTKVHKRDVENLREVLVNRVEKPIKIITKNEIERVAIIRIDIVDKKRMRFQLEHKNHKLLSLLNFRFKNHIQKISYQNNFLEISAQSNDIKDEIKSFIENSECKDMEILFSYDKTKILKFFEYSEENELLSDALILLNSQINEDIDVIKKRYKKLLIQYHPDNVYKSGSEIVKEYTNKFQILQNSYSIVENSISNKLIV